MKAVEEVLKVRCKHGFGFCIAYGAEEYDDVLTGIQVQAENDDPLIDRMLEQIRVTAAEGLAVRQGIMTTARKKGWRSTALFLRRRLVNIPAYRK